MPPHSHTELSYKPPYETILLQASFQSGLQGPTVDRSLSFIPRVVMQGSDRMPPFAHIKGEGLSALVAYLKSL